MTNTKHTPGPWVIVGEGGQTPYIESRAGDWVRICQLYETNFSNDDCHEDERLENASANALLIAAAPELLQMLRDAKVVLVEQCGLEADCELITELDALVKKAGV